MCVIEQIVVKYKNLFHFRMFSTILAIFLLQIYTLLTIYLKKPLLSRYLLYSYLKKFNTTLIICFYWFSLLLCTSCIFLSIINDIAPVDFSLFPVLLSFKIVQSNSLSVSWNLTIIFKEDPVRLYSANNMKTNLGFSCHQSGEVFCTLLLSENVKFTQSTMETWTNIGGLITIKLSDDKDR